MYKEIEVNVYRKEKPAILTTVNINSIRSYSGTEQDRVKIEFKSIDFLVIDETYSSFKHRMEQLLKD